MEDMKRAAARAAVELIQDGMIVGLGTGSTAKHAVDAVGEKIRNGMKLIGVPTSIATEAQARSLQIPLKDLNEVTHLDLTIDGADEVDPDLQLVKGAGGALFREKLVAMSSGKFLVVVDESKLVDRLGTRMPLPVEILQFGWQRTAERVIAVMGGGQVRMKNNAPFISDNGGFILDCPVPAVPVRDLWLTLKKITGVVESGLFLDMTTVVFVAGKDGVKRLDPKK
jgi:ribose 5-phosphate isomerase A